MIYLLYEVNVEMIELLLYISIGFVFFGYILYFILILIGKNKIVSKCDGFDATKDIISEYNMINVIENNSYFTIYNIRRKVIKLSSQCYYGKDLSSISLSLMEAGVSIVDSNKNKYIDFLRILFSNLKLLYIFPIIALFVSNSSFNINDAKVGIFLLLIFSFISYIVLEIKGYACYFVNENLSKIKDISKENRNKIISFMNKLLFCDKIIYFGELIMIIRLVFIMFEIK